MTNNVLHGHGDDDGEEQVPYVRSSGIIGKFEDLCEELFHVRKRKTTIRREIILGVVQWISCLYVLPVVPEQMHRAHYEPVSSIVATSAMCCLGCIYGSVLTNMPFIIAPPTSVSIFLAVFLQQQGLGRHDGNNAVVISGVLLLCVGLIRPLGTFVARLIPDCIQAATAVGIGLITALAGATEVHMVIRGKYTVLDMGELTPEILICMASVIVVAVMLHFHVKGAFCIGLIFGTLIQWMVAGSWPKALVFDPAVDEDYVTPFKPQVVLLLFNLIFLYILTLNGLARSMSDLAHLTKDNGAIPRGRWLFIVCGISTIISGLLSGPPILISPESAAGIKAGAKTGLSTLVCGALFGVSTFFSPLFAAVPPAGTAPLLIMVGVLLFQNSKRVDWYQPRFAVPAYCCLFFIPFTYSILRGVSFGYITYILIGMFTGDFWVDCFSFLSDYLLPKPKPVDGPNGDHHEAEPDLVTVLTDPMNLGKNLKNMKLFDMTYSSEISGDATITKVVSSDTSGVDGLMGGYDNQEAAREAARLKHEEAYALFTKLSGVEVNDYNPLARFGFALPSASGKNSRDKSGPESPSENDNSLDNFDKLDIEK